MIRAATLRDIADEFRYTVFDDDGTLRITRHQAHGWRSMLRPRWHAIVVEAGEPQDLGTTVVRIALLTTRGKVTLLTSRRKAAWLREFCADKEPARV